MNFYRIVNVVTTPEEILMYCGNQSDAHNEAKAYGQWRWPNLRVELIDVDTDKSSITRLLNGVGPERRTALRTWILTERGGMVEVATGE